MDTPLSSFKALVKFQFDRAGLTSEIGKVRKQLQGLSDTQERSDKRREQSAARAFLTEMRMNKVHSQALKENIAFDEKRRKALDSWFVAREKHEAKAEKESQARRSREVAAQDKATAAHAKSTATAAREEVKRVREVARARATAARGYGGSGGGGHTGGSGSSSNTNPWHIGTMAGGLGGLITRGNLAAVGAGTALQQMYTTANFTAAREPRYEFLTGSKEGGAKQIKYLNELVDELHLDLIATDNSYTQFLGAVNSSIGADKAQKTFKTIQSFGVMMGASPESLQRGTKAIQQMLSKQKLSAEELTGQMAEANLIPGATQVFADVLEGGSVKKLFDNMQKGKYDLQDIVKVLDSLESKLKKDLLTKMFSKPSVAMNDFRTALTRFWEQVNESGGNELLMSALNGMADALKGATQWMKENKTTIDAWVNRVRHAVSILWDLKEVLFALYVTNKLFSVKNAAGDVVAGGLARIWRIFSQVPVLPPAPLSVRIINFLKSGMRMALRAWPVLAAAFIYDLIETLQGKDTLLSTWASSDNPFISFIAKIPILLGEAIANLGIGGLLLYDWIIASVFGDESDKKVVREAASMWATDMMNIIDKWGLRPSYEFFQESIRRFGYLGAALAGAMTGDLSKTTMNLGMFTHSIQTFGFDTKTHQAALAEMRGRDNGLANAAWMQQSQPFSGTNLSFMLPRKTPQLVPTNLSIVVNAQGTPDDILKMTNDSFTTLLQSTLLGTMANHQGGK